jgi:DNA polymerase-3 subunit gamma/tau
MSLYQKHRPSSFEEVVGNAATIAALKSDLAKSDRPHVLLFCGPTGTGKTTLARLVAKYLGCAESEFREYNSANTRGIDTIRAIQQNTRYYPLDGEIKIYLLDECQGVTGPAAEALLKMLEDTPEHVYFILCTTQPEKLTSTLRNRCTIFPTSNLKIFELYTLINKVLEKENKTLPNDIKKEIAEVAEGCPRKALVILDKIMDLPVELMREAILDGSVDDATTLELCRLLISKVDNIDVRWNEMSVKLRNFNLDPELARKAILGYMQGVMLRNTGDIINRASQIIELFSKPFFDSGKPGLIRACYLALF